METRKCWVCHNDLPLTEKYFYKQKDKFQRACKVCQQKRNKEYREKNREYFKKKGKERYDKSNNPERYQKYRDSYLKRREKNYTSINGRLYTLFDAARQRSKKKKIEFDIDYEYILNLYNVQNGKCKITGIPFSFERNEEIKGKFVPFGPSIDRINPNLGYIKSNIRLVLVIVNLSLNTFGMEYFDEMCKAYIKNKVVCV